MIFLSYYKGPHLDSRLGPGFFLEHGRPEVAICDSKTIIFWPDEWDTVLHGVKAIGNYVKVYITNQQKKGPLNPGVWRRGRIVEYVSIENKHKILLDAKECSSGDSSSENVLLNINSKNDVIDAVNNNDNNINIENIIFTNIREERSDLGINSNNQEISSGTKMITSEKIIIPINEKEKNMFNNKDEDIIIWESKDLIKVSLNDCKICWTDNNKNKNLNLNLNTKKSLLSSSSSSSSSTSLLNNANKIPLHFSSKDVGSFCRVWWSRYQRFFYGRIISYNPNSKEHRITYEDGDTRTYDMSTKIYELIFLPVSLSLLGARDESECAQLVAVWHTKHLKSKFKERKKRQIDRLIDTYMDAYIDT